MTMLCVDASTTNFGLAWFVDGKLDEVDSFSVSGVYDLDKARRIHSIFEKVVNIGDVDQIVFERPVPMRFVHTVIPINQIMGILCAVAFHNCIDVDMVHARTIQARMGLKCKGKEKKFEAIALAKKLYPAMADTVSTHDIADAILIGETQKILMSEIIERSEG